MAGREQDIKGREKGTFNRPGILGGNSLEGEGHWVFLHSRGRPLQNPLSMWHKRGSVRVWRKLSEASITSYVWLLLTMVDPRKGCI